MLTGNAEISVSSLNKNSNKVSLFPGRNIVFDKITNLKGETLKTKSITDVSLEKNSKFKLYFTLKHGVSLDGKTAFFSGSRFFQEGRFQNLVVKGTVNTEVRHHSPWKPLKSMISIEDGFWSTFATYQEDMKILTLSNFILKTTDSSADALLFLKDFFDNSIGVSLVGKNKLELTVIRSLSGLPVILNENTIVVSSSKNPCVLLASWLASNSPCRNNLKMCHTGVFLALAAANMEKIGIKGTHKCFTGLKKQYLSDLEHKRDSTGTSYKCGLLTANIFSKYVNVGQTVPDPCRPYESLSKEIKTSKYINPLFFEDAFFKLRIYKVRLSQKDIFVQIENKGKIRWYSTISLRVKDSIIKKIFLAPPPGQMEEFKFENVTGVRDMELDAENTSLLLPAGWDLTGPPVKTEVRINDAPDI